MSLKEFDAATGRAMPADEPAPPATAPQGPYAVLKLSEIVSSLTNPRKTFDPDKLAGLATSIKSSGVHEPIIVRPLPARRLQDTFEQRRKSDPLPGFEIVAGERRFRASKLADVETIPVLIRALSDDQVLEIQIVENLQRDDLSELEEAEGYDQLVKATGIDKAAIGDKIGRSRAYVYARLKLLDLCGPARDALRGGAIDQSKALLIARIPDEKLQLKALKAFTEVGWDNEIKLSQRGAAKWIQDNVLLKLKDARFKIVDATLVEAAGACGDCGKRTGAVPDLFQDIANPDICTDPKCFHAKEDAHTARLTAAAKEKGLEIIEGKAAKAIKPSSYSDLKGFKELDTRLRNHETGKDVTLRSVLTKDEMAGQVKAFVDPHDGTISNVVPDALFDMARVRLGGNKASKSKGSGESPADKKFRLEREYHGAWRTKAIEQITTPAALRKADRFEPPLLRRILALVLQHEDFYDEARALLGMEGDAWISADEIESTIAQIPDLELGARVCTVLLHTEKEPDFEYVKGCRTVLTESPVIDSMAATCGIDLGAVRAEVQEEIRAAAREAAAQAKAGAGGKKSAAAAQATANANGKKATGAKAPRTTKEDAQQGIAEAMQQLSDQPAVEAGAGEDPSAPTKVKTPKGTAGKKGTQSFTKAMQPSAELAVVVGTDPLPRTEIVSKLWVYIKTHGLQDNVNKRIVNSDAALEAIFGKKQVSMFEMAGLVGKHVK